MPVEISLSLAADSFRLGRLLATAGNCQYRLGTAVPGPFTSHVLLWVTGDVPESFEADVRGAEHVGGFERVHRCEQSAQYYLDWQYDDGFVGLLEANDAVVLEGGGDSTWSFDVQFADRDDLVDFYDGCVTADIDFRVESVASLEDRRSAGSAEALTVEQREALLLALEEGYFAVPKETTLTELGERLDISQQAVSQRLNRGIRRCLHDYFDLSPAADGDG